MNLLLLILILSITSCGIRIAPLSIPSRFHNHRLLISIGSQLPPVIMLLLVMQSIKIQEPLTPQMVGLLATALMHLWKRKTILSILCGLAAFALTTEVIK